ncbi:hypothetical protein L3V83_11400 [Thiotrichales bacterium 19X7-9]|nr:hypothetical protein [Thiotrichales bacterium 19X7-9]
MNIIPAMKALGYHPDDKGVCYGISHMGTQALLRNDFATFQKRMELIHSLSQTDLTSQIEAAEAKRFLKQPLSERDNLLLSIKPFFDGISVYQNAFSKSDLTVKQNIHPMISHQDYHVGNELFNDSSSEEGVYTQSKELRIFNRKSLKEFLRLNESKMLEVEDIDESVMPSRDGYERIGATKKDVLSYSISNGGHTISLAFDKEQWHVINHDQIYCGTNKSKLADVIMDALDRDNEGTIAVYMEENTKTPTSHEYLPVIKPSISSIKSPIEAAQLLHVAMHWNLQSIASTYFNDVIDKYGRSKHFHLAIGNSPRVVDHFFNQMLTTGNHRLIKRYCNKVNDFDGFTYEDQKAIFNPELQSQRNRGIYTAINRNNHQALKAYFDGIRLSWLLSEDKCTQILSHLSDSNITRLFNESKVKKETMEVYVETLTRLKLGEVERSKLPETLRDALPPIPKREPFPNYASCSMIATPPRIFSEPVNEQTPLLSVSPDL